MTTVIIEDNTPQAKKFVQYVRTLPFAKVKKEKADKPIKWTAKMKRSFAQAENGETYEVNMNNFWDV